MLCVFSALRLACGSFPFRARLSSSLQLTARCSRHRTRSDTRSFDSIAGISCDNELILKDCGRVLQKTSIRSRFAERKRLAALEFARSSQLVKEACQVSRAGFILALKGCIASATKPKTLAAPSPSSLCDCFCCHIFGFAHLDLEMIPVLTNWFNLSHCGSSFVLFLPINSARGNNLTPWRSQQ